MEAKKKSLISPIAFVLLVGILVSLGYTLLKPVSGSVIALTFLDVGQGDAMLAVTPKGQGILVDGGPNDSVLSGLDENIPFYNHKLSAIVLTHPHADHVAGLVSVVGKYQVDKVYMSGTTHTAPEYLAFLEALQNRDVPVQIVSAGDKLDFGDGVRLDFLYPLTSMKDQKAGNLNLSSVVTRLSWGKSSAINLGDLEAEGQSMLIASGQGVKADILKVAHHGSKDSINEAFLSAVDPKYAVISVGKDNRFGHPNKSALDSLSGRIIYRTDYDGDLRFELTEGGVSSKM